MEVMEKEQGIRSIVNHIMKRLTIEKHHAILTEVSTKDK